MDNAFAQHRLPGKRADLVVVAVLGLAVFADVLAAPLTISPFSNTNL